MFDPDPDIVARVEAYTGRCGLPRRLGAEAEVFATEGSIAPSPLSFAQARLDETVGWEEGGEAEWWQRVEESFGERFESAVAVYNTLVARFGIYYYDLAPRNVRGDD